MVNSQFLIQVRKKSSVWGATDTDPDAWSDKYGLFFHDKITPFPPNELPLTRALYGEATDDVEMFVRNPMVPDGVYISASARPLRTSNGGGVVVVFRDVTERGPRRRGVDASLCTRTVGNC